MPDYSALDWVKNTVFYQIFPERFSNGDPGNDPPGTMSWDAAPTADNYLGGDLQGIRDHLPYLEDLGVTALYLTPIFKARLNHKYDTSDYFQVDPAFGTEELLRDLVSEAHERNMRIILDAVFNHCGDSFWAFEDLMSNGVNSPYKDWFFPTSLPVQQNPANYQTCGGATFLPKLNVSNPQVRAHLMKAAVHWLRETGIDGWRLDVPWKVPLEFWREVRKAVKATSPEAYIVAEAWRDTTYWLGDDPACDGVMNYPLRDYLLDYCVRDAMDAEDIDFFIHRQLAQHGVAAPYLLTLLGSHDTPRLLTMCKGDAARAILAVAMQFTLVGTPMIYYGDEVGMEGREDPDNRRGMLWDSNTWNSAIYQAHRLLAQARRQHPALSAGGFETLLTFNGVYAYRRSTPGDQVVVVINPRQARQSLSLSISETAPSIWRDLFTGKIYECDSGNLRIDQMPSKQALVLFPVTNEQRRVIG
ncbi:MAG: glycoside hydrolase family 13 protein [Anaerolineales bacterium]